MVVVVGEEQDGDSEDVILIPDQEHDNEIRKTKNFSCLSGVPLILTGNLIFGISIYIWTISHVSWHEEAAPILWILIETGIFMVTYGIIIYSNPPEIDNLEMISNGKQFSYSLPLKQILISMSNVICGVTGIITMCTLGPSSWWPSWNIIGLIISILILLYSLISAMCYYSKTNRRMISSPYTDLHKTKLNRCDDYLGELLDSQVEMFRKLLPLPSLSSFPIADQAKEQPRKITNKPVHILYIILAMVGCIVIFSAQLWFIVSMDCNTEQGCYNSFEDPKGAFARDWDITELARVEDRKLVILISTPITFLLCTLLLLLFRESTELRMLLSCLVCFGLGLFYFIFSIFSVQYIIMIGVSLSSLSKLLTLISLMPVPLLAALFLALSYSNIMQLKEEDDVCIKHTKICLSISSILSIIFFSISLVTMTTSTLVIMSTMQGHWNTTHSQTWDEECNDNVYDDGHLDYDQPTTSTPNAKHDKCYGKKLDHSVQEILTFYSISQLCLTEAILFLSLFAFLTNRRITNKSLFFPGILLFATAISTIISFFSGLVHFGLNGLLFLLLNGLNTLSALIIGLICIAFGVSVFISFVTVIYKIILSIFVFVFIIILTVLQAFLKLASTIINTNNMKTQPEVATA